MKTFAVYICLCLALLFSLGAPNLSAAAGGGGSLPVQRVDTDLDRAERAIQAKEFDRAVTLLNGVVSKDPQDAEAWNLLGYSERLRGNMDAAFRHYERALAIDPKHRGAHEYLGETYLLTGNLPKAEEQLAILDKLCFFTCSEYRDLKAAIAAYKAKQPR